MTTIHPSEWDAQAVEDAQDCRDGTGSYATDPWRPTYPDEDVSPCTGVGCSECKQLGCDRDYGDD